MVNRVFAYAGVLSIVGGLPLGHFVPIFEPIGQAEAQSCHPSYEGVCIAPGNSDVDCAGGSGNGPRYARGPFRVVGTDQYRLDGDRDGIGCE